MKALFFRKAAVLRRRVIGRKTNESGPILLSKGGAICYAVGFDVLRNLQLVRVSHRLPLLCL
jgi:hypothetical protein